MAAKLSRQEMPPQDPGPSGLSTPRSVGVAGILFAVFFATSIVLVRSFVAPESMGPLAAIAGVTIDSVAIVPAYLMPFAGIAFLWFIGVVRDRVGVLEDRFYATVFLGSGIVFVAMLFASASVVAGLLTLTQPTGDTTALGQAIARAMLYMFGARSAGVFTLVTSMIILRTHALSRWAAFVGLAIGLVLLLGVQSFDLIILLFPAWVALISVIILVVSSVRTGLDEAGSRGGSDGDVE